MRDDETSIHIDVPMTPPAWVLLQRELLRANTAACREFFAKYYDERGFLLCVERWGGNDGPDDAMESCIDWPLLHTLGADDVVREMADRAWEGHLRQYTLARTTQVPFAREGMYYMVRSAREVSAAFDLFRCEPRPDLLSERAENGAYCLANPGTEYAICFPSGGHVQLDLRDDPERFSLRWYDIEKGEWTASASLQEGGQIRLTTPGDGSRIAILQR